MRFEIFPTICIFAIVILISTLIWSSIDKETNLEKEKIHLLKVLSLLFPIIGLIIFLINRNNKLGKTYGIYARFGLFLVPASAFLIYKATYFVILITNFCKC